MLDKAAEAHFRSGALDRAEALTQRFIDLGEQNDVGPQDPAMAAAAGRLAAIYEKAGDPRAAEMRMRARAPSVAPAKAPPRRRHRFS